MDCIAHAQMRAQVRMGSSVLARRPAADIGGNLLAAWPDGCY
jgi:hypothetical protein